VSYEAMKDKKEVMTFDSNENQISDKVANNKSKQ
jgi:hypothetical protein